MFFHFLEKQMKVFTSLLIVQNVKVQLVWNTVPQNLDLSIKSQEFIFDIKQNASIDLGISKNKKIQNTQLKKDIITKVINCMSKSVSLNIL